MSDEITNGGRRQVRGRVTSNKMDKTVVVEVERTVKHPRYHKYIKQVRSFKAHDEDNACQLNDMVIIEESRPLSRTKRWKVIERIVRNAKADSAVGA